MRVAHAYKVKRVLASTAAAAMRLCMHTWLQHTTQANRMRMSNQVAAALEGEFATTLEGEDEDDDRVYYY